jgi:hypothetical protein
MKNVSIDTITQAFVDYCSDDTDTRTMFVLQKMVEHLHAFAKKPSSHMQNGRAASNS